MILYHEASPAALSSILTKGLKRTSRGVKGDDQSIIETDALLDKRRTSRLIAAGLSRDNSLYAYIGTDTYIIDITSGNIIDIHHYAHTRPGHLLKLDIKQERCYVSDLDKYDRLKQGIIDNAPQKTLDQWADEYWSTLIPLHSYQLDTVRRPEVMIPYDLPAECIHPLAD